MKFTLLFVIILFSSNSIFAQHKPEAVKAYNEGVASYRAKEYKKAVQLYSKAIKIEPNYIKAYYNRATAKMILKDYVNAIKDLDRVIKKAPKHEKAINKRGLAQLKSKNYEEAITDFTLLLELDPEHASAYLNRAISNIKLDKCDKAIIDLTDAINYKKNNVNALYNRGSCYMKSKDYDLAITDFDNAISLKSDFNAAILNRGKSNFYSKNYEAALSDLIPLSKKSKYAKKTLYDIGRIYEKTEEPEKALESFSAYLMLDISSKNIVKANKKIANIAYEEQEFDLVENAYTALILEDSNNKMYHLNRGLVKYKLTKYEDAVYDFKAAIAIDDRFAEAYFNRANAYSKLGIDEAACNDMTKANQLGYKEAEKYIKGWCK